MKLRYLFFILLLANIELFAKKLVKPKPIEDSIDQSIKYRGKSKNNKQFCSLSVKDCLNAGQLNVCGSTSLKNLTVTGTETVTGTLNVNGSLFVNGTPITCPCGITLPSTSTPNAIVLFANNTGNSLKQSPAPVTIDPSNNVNNINNITMVGNLNMVATPSDLSAGVITKVGQRFIYDLGGSTSTFVGVNAGLASALSFGNTGIGFDALGSMANGSSNTAIGRESMHFVASGSFNTALGALSFIQSTGSFNTALGYNTLQGLTGNGNVAVGSGTLQNTTGADNTAIGFGAGNALVGGSNNIYIGANAGSVITESTTTRIGVEGVQTACFIAGISGVEITGTQVVVDGNGQLGVLPPSSRRYKQNISDMGDSTDNLSKLRPVKFEYKPGVIKSAQIQSEEIQYGLIAEEVAEFYPELVVYKDGQPETVKYYVLNVMLLNRQNKLEKKLEEQDKIIKQLQDQVARLSR